MDIELIKSLMKEKKMTQKNLSDITGVPLQTIKYIFTGRTSFPRIDTVQAIEKALGLDKETIADISVEERDFIEVFRQLTEEEKKEFFSIADFILAKRQ